MVNMVYNGKMEVFDMFIVRYKIGRQVTLRFKYYISHNHSCVGVASSYHIIVSHRIVSHRIVSHRIVSHRIVSYRIVSGFTLRAHRCWTGLV